MKRWLPLLFLLPLTAQASSPECKALIKELETMRQAQQVMLTSLASNHEVFAASIEDMTSELRRSGRKAPPKAVNSIEKTAKAYRQRGLKAKKQAEDLDEATEDLIQRLARCL